MKWTEITSNYHIAYSDDVDTYIHNKLEGMFIEEYQLENGQLATNHEWLWFSPRLIKNK